MHETSNPFPSSSSSDLTSNGGRQESETENEWGRPLAEVSNRAKDLFDTVMREAKARPLRTALISAGIGYVAGGGLFSPLTGRVFSASVRMALRALAIPALARGAVELGRQIADRYETTDDNLPD